MPKLVRPALQDVRTRVFDSARWAGYQPRSDDIIVATYSKCGTTWAQRIVSMLIFASPEARRATKT
jgi:aryl sulfotransferase